MGEGQYTKSILCNLIPNSEKEIFSLFCSLTYHHYLLNCKSSLKNPEDLEHANLFSITSLKFFFVCTLHIPLHKELHWHKFLSAGTTTSCYASTHFKAHNRVINKTFCKSLVISESPFNTQAVYFPSSPFPQTMK